MRKPLTREQVLDFNGHWNNEDRKIIEAFLDGRADSLPLQDTNGDRDLIMVLISRIPERLHHMYVVQSNTYVSGRTENGAPLFGIRRGAIDLQLPGRVVPVIDLSRARTRPHGKRAAERPVDVCPNCFTARSANGECLC